jgi:hypothetical protein
MPPPARFELWDLGPPFPACRGRFPTRREAYRWALRLRLTAYQVRPAGRGPRA